MIFFFLASQSFNKPPITRFIKAIFVILVFCRAFVSSRPNRLKQNMFSGIFKNDTRPNFPYVHPSTAVSESENPQYHDTLEKICIIGSGNWGSTIARIIGGNAAGDEECESEVNMWVYEEEVDGRNLTDIINTDHENVKYLKGHKIPENVIAVSDIRKAAEGATLLIFVLPHQFLPPLLAKIKSVVHPSCRGVSLIKGLVFLQALHLNFNLYILLIILFLYQS